jgi:negative regulator of sigma-B (phosphoserine phosphatase)
MNSGTMNVGMARRSANAGDVCGDMAGWWSRDGLDIVTVADGLGHGKDAATAAGQAIAPVAAWPGCDPIGLFQRMSLALHPTRGAAVAVAVVDWAAGQIRYAAVGNTRAAVFGARVIRLDSYPGIVGGGYRRLAVVDVPFQSGDVLALWTDGLEERLHLTRADHAGAGMDGMAAGLLERFAQGEDDRCIVVARLDLA